MTLNQTIIVEDQTYEISLVIESVSTFLAGNDGVAVEIQKSATHIQWRYVGGTWINLVSLASLTGANGQEIELQASATHIQWKLANDLIWTDLVALVDLQGEPGDDGREIEIQKSPTHIQWRYIGDVSWTDLVSLVDLQGEPGDEGQEVMIQKSATHIQWKYADDIAWTDLVALADITGTNGLEVELQKTATHIQWRLTGGTWADLVALTDITGPPGASATPEYAESRRFPGGSAPAGWTLQGSVLSQAAYPATFAKVGLLHDFSSVKVVAVTNSFHFGGIVEVGGILITCPYSNVFRSSDYGDSWVQVVGANAHHIGRLAVIPGVTPRIVCGTGSGRVYTSDDQGATWARRDGVGNDPFEGTAINHTLWTGTSILLFGSGGKIARTLDGETLTTIVSGTAIDLIGGATNGSIIAAYSTTSFARYSEDDGVTWAAGVVWTGNNRSYGVRWNAAWGCFISFGDNHHYTVSVDGKNWSSNLHSFGNRYAHMPFGDGMLLGGVNGGNDLQLGKGNQALIQLPKADHSGAHTQEIFRCSNGDILCGTGYASSKTAKFLCSYNIATDFRLPSAALDAGVYNDTYFYTGV